MCVGARLAQDRALSPDSLRALDPLPGLSGSEPAEKMKLGNSSSGRAPERAQLVYSIASDLPSLLQFVREPLAS